jgi:Mrp family chromosome partitioning ATPase
VEKQRDELPVMRPGDIERAKQERAIKAKLSRIKRKVLVMSGKGGVGKSTVAAYLAVMLSRKGWKVGLVDVDLHGPSIPRLLGIQGGFQITKGTVHALSFSENLKVSSLEMALANRDTAVIWRGTLKMAAVKQYLCDLEWGDLDFLVIDSPPGTGDEPLTVAQMIPDAEALIVTTPQEISLADVRKSINFCHKVHIKILGVVENMSGFFCPHCREKIRIFGEGGGQKMAAGMGVPMLGEIPIDQKMVDSGDTGQLAALADEPGLDINVAYLKIVDKIERG